MGFGDEAPQDARRNGYDPDLAAAVCARIEAGESLRRICREPGMPSPQTLHQWRMGDPLLAERYAAAQAAARRNQIQEDEAARLRRLEARKQPWGRPDTYTDAIGGEICRRLAQGESLVAIGGSPGMPVTQTIYKWLRKHADFRQDYARAREVQAQIKEELAWEIAMRARPETARVARLQFDVIRWQLGRLSPKKYAEDAEPEGFDMDVYIRKFGCGDGPDTLELVAGPSFEAAKARAERERGRREAGLPPLHGEGVRGVSLGRVGNTGQTPPP
ncbi:hypothetical protein [Phenylobacterium sp.]|uniref:terminase small subunit-like protein n=1 Tax=Phenylobacterium sp. TaxID=1871053 RepID=UPI00271DA3A9|nr:hypothetical protein [Phenylobacterium sp.]MDO8378754.1 hypothetical protein [Phenylobacterium sp.]